MYETIQPAYGLHPYQRQVARDAIRHLSREGSRVVAHMPTGAGKTRIAAHVACEMLKRRDADGKAVVWLASNEELCDQAADELSRAWTHLGDRPASVYRYWGDTDLSLRDLGDGFLVAGLQKLWAVSGNDVRLLNSLAERAAGVIFDEAHQAVAHTYRFISEQMTTYRPPLLGLTATPGRAANIGDPDYELAEMFGFDKVTIEHPGYTDPVSYLIREGFLARPAFKEIDVDASLDVSAPPPGSEFTRDDLEGVGESEAWRSAIVEATETALRWTPRVIVFAPSVGATTACADDLRSAGFQAEVVVANTPSEKRRRIVDRFRSDDSARIALLNYGVFTAGFDAPKTRCAVIGRPTTSLVLYSQMCGRAMRGPRSGGNRNCRIYTVVDRSLPGFATVAEAFTNWDSVWAAE